MPIYEYQCEQCGQVQEALQRISEKPLSKCSHCSGKLHKLISHSTFHLKGTGWYVTDYAGKNKNNKTSTTNTDTKAQSSGSSSGSSEASTTSTSSTASKTNDAD